MRDSNVKHNIFCCTPSLRVIIPTSPPLLFSQYTIFLAAMRNFVNRADIALCTTLDSGSILRPDGVVFEAAGPDGYRQRLLADLSDGSSQLWT